MGKGKRNRQFHFEDKQQNPEKYKEPKKPFRMPKWATYTIWSALVILVVGAIVLTSLFQNGVFLRSRILLNSQGQDDTYDLNQQMATFIVWQNIYQQAYQEFFYAQYVSGYDTNNIVKTYGSAINYAITMANYYATAALRDGVDLIADYLEEMVAGADKAVAMGFTLDNDDQKSIEELVNWIKGIHQQYAGAYPFENFLNVFVAQGVKESDIRKAATLMAMYTKYCDYTKLELDNERGEGDENKLLDFIARNPSGHYEAVYRMYQVNDKAFADKLATAKTVEEFTTMVVDRVMEVNFDTLALNKYTAPKATADEALIITALANKGASDKTDDDLAAAIAKAKELGLTEVSYKKVTTTADGKTTATYTPDLSETLSKFIFASSRKAGDVDVLTDAENKVMYLVYIYEANDADANPDDTMIVKAGVKEYKLSDDADKFESFKASIIKDLNTADRKNTTDHKSAEDLAKDFYEKLKKDTKTEFPADAKTETFDKPGENDVTHAIQDFLFEEGKTVKANDVYQVDDNGTTYVVLVTNAHVEGKNYTVKYATYEDSDYYHFFRNIKSKLDSTYPATAPTLSHPEATTEKSFEEWMCEAEVIEATATEITKRTFKRAANEIKAFDIKNDKDEVTGYKVYIVVEPMKLLQTEDATVYGGYLKYESEAAANEAFNSLKDKKGFDLWHAFQALSVTTGEGEKQTTTNATLETDIVEADLTDENLKKWMFDKERKADDLKVVASKDGKAFYLSYFKSTEQKWTRNTRDEWVTAELTEILDKLVSDGGYKLDQGILDKIGEPTPTTAPETTAAPEESKKPE